MSVRRRNKEAFMTTSRFIQNASLAAALGVFGGTILVLSHVFFTPGKYLLIPYSLVVIATTVVVRAEHIAAFRDRFAVGFGSFAIASLALYVAVSVSPASGHVPLLGHAWRLGLLAAIGVAINLPAARLAGPSNHLVATSRPA
jgi:hypothetical protein